MLHSWMIGDTRVTSVVEYYAPTHDPVVLFPDFDRAVFDAALPRLLPGHYYPGIDRLVVAIQIWLVETGDRRILIDTGCGNGKSRRTPRMNGLNTLWPSWLAAAGQSFETITDVVLTHLHADHVGWNTVPGEGGWVPAFPNARYHIPQVDHDWFAAAHADGRMADGGSFQDSVAPVVQAGQAEFIADGAEIAGVLQAEAAPGHTPGQLVYWLDRPGGSGVFSADIMHHTVQVLQPGWNTAFCILPEEARQTRARFLDMAATRQARVMPCHFAPPHSGFIARDGRDYLFVPEL